MIFETNLLVSVVVSLASDGISKFHHEIQDADRDYERAHRHGETRECGYQLNSI